MKAAIVTSLQTEIAMLKALVTFVFLLIITSLSSAQTVSGLVGSYRMEVQGGDLLELRDNGTASMAGEETVWSARGNQLTIGSEVMQYKLQGDRLLLTIGTVKIAWKRIGGEVKGSSLKKKPVPETQARQSGNGETNADREAKQLLTSTAWCSFSYNKSSGTSTTRKVVFRPDGVMTVNGGSETYSSGYGGTYAGQSNNGSAMKWKVENLRMYLDQGNGAGFQDIGLNATKNSNGYVILHAGGQEYSMCK
jgi:hypothetical protein